VAVKVRAPGPALAHRIPDPSICYKATLFWLPGYQLIKVAKRGIMENRGKMLTLR